MMVLKTQGFETVRGDRGGNIPVRLAWLLFSANLLVLVGSAFADHNKAAERPRVTESLLASSMSPLFTAVVEATEEAIYNALFKATSLTGRGNRIEALPLLPALAILRKYDVLNWDETLPPGNVQTR